MNTLIYWNCGHLVCLEHMLLLLGGILAVKWSVWVREFWWECHQIFTSYSGFHHGFLNTKVWFMLRLKAFGNWTYVYTFRGQKVLPLGEQFSGIGGYYCHSIWGEGISSYPLNLKSWAYVLNCKVQHHPSETLNKQCCSAQNFGWDWVMCRKKSNLPSYQIRRRAVLSTALKLQQRLHEIKNQRNRPGNSFQLMNLHHGTVPNFLAYNNSVFWGDDACIFPMVQSNLHKVQTVHVRSHSFGNLEFANDYDYVSSRKLAW
jgi:hypothetical protein